jgi:hypothetical protein
VSPRGIAFDCTWCEFGQGFRTKSRRSPASDFPPLDAVMARYGRTLFDTRMLPASLDHAMWFHRPFRSR